MKRIFLCILAMFIFAGCPTPGSSSNSSKHSGNGNSGGSNSGNETEWNDDNGGGNNQEGTYTCHDIYSCQYDCTNQACQEACFNQGSSSGKSTISKMYTCWNSYCASENAAQTCLDDYCYDETHECPLWTTTDCPSIYECLTNGGSDECVSAGSNEGQTRFWALYNCTQDNCSSVADSEWANCAKTYCSSEIYKCGFRD